MSKMDNLPRIEEPITSKVNVSKWTTVRENINSGFLNRACEHQILRRKIYASISKKNFKDKDKEALNREIMDLLNDPEVLRRLSMQEDSRTQIALQELMAEAMEMYAEKNSANRSDSIKRLKGIIKKTMNCDCGQKPTKPRNSVHFSDENIYFEIPRRQKHKFNVATEKCTHYCCFGFLFPT